MPNYRVCRRCILLEKSNDTCKILKQKVDPSADTCPRYAEHVYTCELCNSQTLEPQYIFEQPDTWHVLCGNCAEQLSSCHFCQGRQHCEFETNPDPMPKQVMRQVRTQMGIAQATVKNPDRIEKFCKTCRCYAEEECRKESGYCGNLDFIWKGKTEE